MKGYQHVPVLLNEVISLLAPRAGENFVDATLGGGGYTRAILNRIEPDGKVLAIDLDEEAIENFKLSAFAKTLADLRQISNAKNHPSLTLPIKGRESKQVSLPEGEGRIQIVQGNFARIDKIVEHHKFYNISGVVADIGLSSYQLDQSERGISFQKKEILDMRFDRRGNATDAKFILNGYSQHQLEKIFREYGEEKFSRQIAKKVIGNREQGISNFAKASSDFREIKYTDQLYQIIQDALPKPIKHKADDSARRIFQALRIAVNHELQNLEEFLPKAFDLLNPGGRLAVVSFHSLEDRIVKRFFVGLTKGCVCPPDFPQCACGRNPQGKLLTKKPIVASQQELEINPRSKPAKLRAIVKI